MTSLSFPVWGPREMTVQPAQSIEAVSTGEIEGNRWPHRAGWDGVSDENVLGGCHFFVLE